jgi:hypothetical protein
VVAGTDLALHGLLLLFTILVALVAAGHVDLILLALDVT